MSNSTLRILPAVLALAFASTGLSAVAQTTPTTTTTQPTVTERAKETGKEAVDATERGAKKAWSATKNTTERAVDATERGTKKAYNATKNTSKKAYSATKKGATKAVDATENAGHAAADGMHSAGNKIGEKIPGTAQNEAVKKQ